MTLTQLLIQREDVAMQMIEAEGQRLKDLEQELSWIQELINELETDNGEEN